MGPYEWTEWTCRFSNSEILKSPVLLSIAPRIDIPQAPKLLKPRVLLELLLEELKRFETHARVLAGVTASRENLEAPCRNVRRPQVGLLIPLRSVPLPQKAKTGHEPSPVLRSCDIYLVD